MSDPVSDMKPACWEAKRLQNADVCFFDLFGSPDPNAKTLFAHKQQITVMGMFLFMTLCPKQCGLSQFVHLRVASCAAYGLQMTH